MSISKEILIDIEEKFDRLGKLIKYHIMMPVVRSYGVVRASTSNIQASLLSLDNVLEKLLLQQTQISTNHKLLGMLSNVKLMLAVNPLNSPDAEDFCFQEKHFNRCQEIIAGYENKPEMVYVAVMMQYHSALFWVDRVPRKAQSHLEAAEKYYFLFKESGQAPIHPNELFKHNLKSYNTTLAWKQLEYFYTLILKELADVHEVLGNSIKLLICRHTVLKRQLEGQEIEFDPIGWVRDCVKLSQRFVEVQAYKQARHHLAACTYVLEKYENKWNPISGSDRYNTEIISFQQCSADVAVAWAEYGLSLMMISKGLLKKEVLTHSEDLNQLNFSSLNLSMYEEKVTYQLLLTFEEAKRVFLNVQDWLKKAELYYFIDSAFPDKQPEYTSNSIKVVTMQSDVYHVLMLYEENTDNKAKLNKRAIDILEKLNLRINPTGFTDYCREIRYRLALRYLDMVQIKSCKLEETSVPTSSALKKINGFVHKGIKTFTWYIDSFCNDENKLQNIDDETFDHEQFVQACFNIAILNRICETSDLNEQLNHCEAAISACNKANEYIKQHPNKAQRFATQLDYIKKEVMMLQVQQALQHGVLG